MVLFWMIPYIYDLFETMKRLFLFIKNVGVKGYFGHSDTEGNIVKR